MSRTILTMQMSSELNDRAQHGPDGKTVLFALQNAERKAIKRQIDERTIALTVCLVQQESPKPHDLSLAAELYDTSSAARREHCEAEYGIKCSIFVLDHTGELQ